MAQRGVTHSTAAQGGVAHGASTQGASTQGASTQSSELDVRAEHAVAHPEDPDAEPSAEWGWHGTFPRTARIGGWAIAAILPLMLIGNHRGRVEDLWLIGVALLIVIVLVRDQMRRRTSWRR